MRLRAQKEVEVEAGGNPPNQVLITVVIEIKVRFKLRRQETELCGQLCRVNERGLYACVCTHIESMGRWLQNTYLP